MRLRELARKQTRAAFRFAKGDYVYGCIQRLQPRSGPEWRGAGGPADNRPLPSQEPVAVGPGVVRRLRSACRAQAQLLHGREASVPLFDVVLTEHVAQIGLDRNLSTGIPG